MIEYTDKLRESCQDIRRDYIKTYSNTPESGGFLMLAQMLTLIAIETAMLREAVDEIRAHTKI